MIRKTFVKTWAEAQERASEVKQFLLDKRGHLEYNILTGGEDELIARFSQAPPTSAALKTLITHFGTLTRLALRTVNPSLPPPIIAGGAIRDMVFGLSPKDYDIFVDMSSLEDNYEVDDTTLDLASLLCESDEKLLITDLSSEPGGLYSDAEAEQSGFISGYETYHRGLAIQVLGRKESSLETIETFDYSLVKAWYDTGEKKFFFHKDFLDQMGQNKIIVKNEKTEERVSNFLRRLPSSPFTIERDKNFEQRQSYRHHTPPVPSLHEF